jgi:hypothetical protein
MHVDGEGPQSLVIHLQLDGQVGHVLVRHPLAYFGEPSVTAYS